MVYPLLKRLSKDVKNVYAILFSDKIYKTIYFWSILKPL